MIQHLLHPPRKEPRPIALPSHAHVTEEKVTNSLNDPIRNVKESAVPHSGSHTPRRSRLPYVFVYLQHGRYDALRGFPSRQSRITSVCVLEMLVRQAEQFADREAVFDCHGGALSLVWQGWMAGVSEQSDTSLYTLAIATHPVSLPSYLYPRR
jgi:hypothetical protein